MGKVFFTADHHFGHEAIIRFANRPFSTVDIMNDEMVSRWNKVVSDEDDVFHLGDFSFYEGQRFFPLLKGKKHLILGNHDNRKVIDLPWESRSHYKELVRVHEGKPYKIILFHYPIEEWNGHFHGNSLHFHGHVHARPLKSNTSFRVDVGVDCFDFKPVTLSEILESKK
jgi:calcineurin-like phosphoesterase family protein